MERGKGEAEGSNEREGIGEIIGVVREREDKCIVKNKLWAMSPTS